MRSCLLALVCLAKASAYEYLNNVTAELGVSVLAAQIQQLVEQSMPDFAAAAALYYGSTTKALATADHSGDADFDAFAQYYNGTAFHDKFIQPCFDDQGVWAGKTLARVECVEKTMQDAIPVAAMLVELNMAIAQASAGNTTSDQAALHVDKAYALFKGGDSSHSPYGRANKRAVNYLALDGNQMADWPTNRAWRCSTWRSMRRSRSCRPPCSPTRSTSTPRDPPSVPSYRAWR
jgi:hypothetical protein